MTSLQRGFRRPTTWLIFLIVLVGGIGLWWRLEGTRVQHSGANAAQQKAGPPGPGGAEGGPPPALPVQMAYPQTTTSGSGQEFLAQAVSRHSVDLRPDVMGRITKIFVASGDRVSAGQPLMVIQPDQQAARTASAQAATQTARSGLGVAQKSMKALRQDLVAASAELALQTKQLQRYKTLATDQSISQTELDQIQNAYDQAVARQRSAQANLQAQQARIAQAGDQVAQATAQTRAEQVNLAFYTIKAPFAGVVGDVPIKLGDYVIQQTTLTSVTDAGVLELYIPVPAESGHKLHQGAQVEVLASDNTRLGRATVFFVAPRVDTVSQTILAKARYDNSEGLLRDQQQIRVRLAWDTKTALTVPAMSIVQQGPKRFVMMVIQPSGEKSAPAPVNDHKKPPSYATKLVPVTLGSYVGDNIEVLSGLTGDERIVTAGMQKVAMMGPQARVTDEAMMGKAKPNAPE